MTTADSGRLASGADDAHADGGTTEDSKTGDIEPGDSNTETPRRKRPWWAELIIMLVGAFALTFVIQTFLFKVYYVPSASMEQTLHGAASGGDRILVNKVVYTFRDPAPGDIVVFRGPASWTPEFVIKGKTSLIGKVGELLGSAIGITPPNERDFVKRVIAVGGQTVSCCDPAGNVVVDGVSLNESYIYQPIPFIPGELDCRPERLAGPGRSGVSQRCFGPVTLPPGSLWMMGDNRSQSGDATQGCQWGRDPAYCQGPVPVANVIGKAIFVILPPTHWKTLGDPGIDHRAFPAVLAPPALGVLGAVGLWLPYRWRARRRRRS